MHVSEANDDGCGALGALVGARARRRRCGDRRRREACGRTPAATNPDSLNEATGTLTVGMTCSSSRRCT